MKKLFLFLSFILLIGMASAITYDDFENGIINATAWQNVTTSSGTGVARTIENGGWMEANVTIPSSGGAGTSNITSINMPDLTSIGTLTINASVISNMGGSNLLSNFATFQVFGVTIMNKTINGVDSGNENAIWTFNKSGTDYDVYRNGVFNRTITPIDNNITIKAQMSCTGTCVQDFARAILYDVSYTLPQPITVGLNSPANATNTINDTILFNSTITPGEGVEIQNATLYIWYPNSSSYNISTTIVTGSVTNISLFNSTVPLGIYTWNVYACGTNVTSTSCDFASRNFTGHRPYLNIDSESFSSGAFETQTQSYRLNLTLSNGVTLSNNTFIHNGTSYTGTSSLISGTSYEFSYSLDVPIILGKNHTFTWNFGSTDGNVTTSTLRTQFVNNTYWQQCNTTVNVIYINYSFKNETTNEEPVSAEITSGNFTFYLGTGKVNKSISYINSSQNPEYTFCAVPQHLTFNVKPTLNYKNSYSQQRTHSPGLTSYTNTTTSTTLLLLPSSEGQFVTLQVVNSAEQAIEGAQILVSRSAIGTIETKTTDASGTAQFFLNPDLLYTFQISKSGFTTFTTSITPTQSSYTITLGGSSTSNADYSKGISVSVNPTAGILVNDTSYTFNMTMNSTFWDLTEFGFFINNGTDDLGSDSVSSANTGTASLSLNTGNHTRLTMNYYWLINGTYTNSTVVWNVLDSGGGGFSISDFFSDLRDLADGGAFGLDEFGLALLAFVAIFITAGILSFRYGLVSPAAIMGTIFALVLFFDVGVGLFPRPTDFLPSYVTILTGVIFAGILFREAYK